MYKILLWMLIIPNIALSANLSQVNSGQVIDDSILNKITNVINNIFEIKIPTGENVYSARVSYLGVVSGENTDWISGNALVSDSNRFQLNFNNNMFSDAPMCLVTVFQMTDPAQLSAGLDGTSNTFVAVRTGYQSGSFVKLGKEFFVMCQRSGIDHKSYKTIRQVLVQAGLTFLN